MTSEVCIQHFRDGYKHRLSERTINLYVKAIRQMLEHCQKPFDGVTNKDIRNWVLHLDENGWKPVTVNSKLYGLKLFYRYAVEEKLVNHNPMDSILFPEINETLPRYLEVKELALLRKHVEGRITERAVIEVLYVTGMRISELAAMKKEDISWSERIILIREGKRKKERIVLFTNICEEHLKKYLNQRKDELPYVFVNTSGTGPICFRTIQKKFKRYERELGFRMTPHTLRHTFAAHLAAKGMPIEGIQTLLGHVSPQQTHLYARLYSHARKQKYDEWM